jgi:hypothetical protein
MVLLAVSPSVVSAETGPDPQAFLKAIDGMMVSIGPESARASATIKHSYRDYMDLMVLHEYTALEGALANGGLVPLPADPLRYNLRPRVDGASPIGEKDLNNQLSYIAARPETIGALLEVASRVHSGSLEITSLVRHSEYQEELKTTNGNANTSVPMHTMGLAFDVALVNTPLKTVYEIRDVLRRMQAAGDILVIGERQQLVFHVVPHPSRLGHFMEVYAKAVADATPGANVIGWLEAETVSAHPTAAVTAEVIAVRPTDAFVHEWWAADDPPSDLTVEVALPAIASVTEQPSLLVRMAAGCVALVSGLLETMRGIIS